MNLHQPLYGASQNSPGCLSDYGKGERQMKVEKNLFKRMLCILCSITVVSSFSAEALAANTAGNYDSAAAVEWASNEKEHKAVKDKGRSVWYVCECLKYGGLDDVAEECARKRSFTPGVMTEYIESQGYGTVTQINDDSLKDLKAGDIVVVFCGAKKHGSGYYGLHAFFVTDVDQDAKTLTYSQNRTYRHNKKISFASLKKYAVKCKSCGNSQNSYVRIISMNSSQPGVNSCQHIWMDSGYCVNVECNKDYVTTDEFRNNRTPLSNVCISAKRNEFFVPSVRPYDQSAFLDLNACYTVLEPTALVINSKNEKWYEVYIDGEIGYVDARAVLGANQGPSQAEKPEQQPSQDKDTAQKELVFRFEFDSSTNMEGFTLYFDDRFTLGALNSNSDAYEFWGWNVKRENDDTWYVSGKGWCTEDTILKNGYLMKVYEPGVEFAISPSWTKGCDSDEYSYTFFPLWTEIPEEQTERENENSTDGHYNAERDWEKHIEWDDIE